MIRKEVKIDKVTHSALHKYCRYSGMKMGHFVEKAIIEKLKRDGEEVPLKEM